MRCRICKQKVTKRQLIKHFELCLEQSQLPKNDTDHVSTSSNSKSQSVSNSKNDYFGDKIIQEETKGQENKIIDHIEKFSEEKETLRKISETVSNSENTLSELIQMNSEATVKFTQQQSLSEDSKDVHLNHDNIPINIQINNSA